MSLSPETRARLRARYLDGIRARMDEMLAVRARLDAGDATAPTDARTLGHQFAGMGASFGFPEHTERGRELEHAPNEGLATALERLLELVRDTLQREH
jgi:HPt (histidine-containing phosphotransfer) domain-containing protein